MTDLDVFLPNIMPKAPGCPEPTAFAEIIAAARKVCERLRIWRSDDEFTVTPTSCNVMCAPDGADVYEIENALLDGRQLQPISLNDLNDLVPNWRTTTEGGKWITQQERGSVLVVPASTGTLGLSLILTPSEDADQLPDFLARDYRGLIADGALAEILMLPMQSFTDPARAQFFQARFDQELGRLSNQGIKGQQRAPSRTRAQYM